MNKKTSEILTNPLENSEMLNSEIYNRSSSNIHKDSTNVKNSIQMESANDGYQLCPTCNKPLINEENLKILRIKWIKWGVLGLLMTLAGGAIGACVLPFLGFGSAGVTAGSFAASWQGPAVAAGSVFAICQSLGATGLGILLFGATGSVIGGVGALGLIYKYREKFGWCCCDDYSESTSCKKNS